MSEDAPPPEDDAPYHVGHKRPPKQHQIKKGERRNPFGRPKSSRNARTIVREQHQRSINVSDNGDVRRISALEAMIRGDVTSALKGDEKAKARQIALALQNADEDEAKAAIKSQQQTLAEDEAILAYFIKEQLNLNE